jgi:hypothetical protein
LSHIHRTCTDGQILIQDTKQSIEDSRREGSANTQATALELRKVGDTLGIDNRRLLKICVGLRVDIKRLGRQHHNLGMNWQRHEDSLAQKLTQNSRALRSTLHPLQTSITQTGVVVRHLSQL